MLFYEPFFHSPAPRLFNEYEIAVPKIYVYVHVYICIYTPYRLQRSMTALSFKYLTSFLRSSLITCLPAAVESFRPTVHTSSHVFVETSCLLQVELINHEHIYIYIYAADFVYIQRYVLQYDGLTHGECWATA